MLYAKFGFPKNPFIDPDVFFDNYLDTSEWCDDKLCLEIVEDIDKSKVLRGGKALESGPLGTVLPYTWMSGGAKFLIMLYLGAFPEMRHISASYGDNCSPWLLRISEAKDVTIWWTHYLKMPKDMSTPIRFVESGATATCWEEYIGELLRNNGNMTRRDVE